MTHRPSALSFARLALAGLLLSSAAAQAQVAGATTTVGVSVTESTQLAIGWSVKKTLMGKSIYNDAGQKVGKVVDLIIAPDKNVSFVIVGAGGFVGIGRHDVAIPITQIQDREGKLVMAGASKAMIEAMPVFTYADDTSKRDRFVAAAERDIARGKGQITDLERRASTAAAEAKARIDTQKRALQADVTEAEGKLSELKAAAAIRWKDFEAGVNAATARLRKTLDTTV
jgi:sporulation protein YlmC with PRC-barrel domain